MGNKRLAIMQPYLFPYIGYFQLINAVDSFVIYDDVNFIKQGWINRNSILVNQKAFMFTLPLENASSFRLIKDIKVDAKLFPLWKTKFLKSLEFSYKNAPFFNETFELISDILTHNSPDSYRDITQNYSESISNLVYKSLKSICTYLNIKTQIIESSVIYENADLKAESRILDICQKEKASTYVNLSGGMDLYSKENFKKINCDLKFIKAENITYSQNSDGFTPNLSIIDLLMFNPKSKINEFLSHYKTL